MSDGVEMRDEIRAFVKARFPLVRERGLGDDDSLLESGALDSLGMLDLVTFIGETFGIELADDDLTPEHFDSVSSLSRLLSAKRRA